MLAATIVAGNYLAQARVLAATFTRHHPDSDFVTLLIDGTEADRPMVRPPGRVIVPSDLGLAAGQWEQMAGIYNVVEFATALKPALLRHLLTTTTHDSVCYLDPDIVVYQPFAEVFELAVDKGIVLTPHVLHPLPRDGLLPDERMLMHAGLFNLGFIGVGRKAMAFLDWWHERLRLDAVVDLPNALFTDQRWCDWVPSLFECLVTNDHGLNVAYWNTHERPLTRAEDATLAAAGQPLKFFHFSGYDIEQPWCLSKHAGERPRCQLGSYPLVAELCRAYAVALVDAGVHEERRRPYRLGTTGTGLVLTPLVRAAYRESIRTASASGAPPPAAPFGPDGGAAFGEWLGAPAIGAPALQICPWHVQLWRARPDLQAAFPDLDGADGAHYRVWLDHDVIAQRLGEEIRAPQRRSTRRGRAAPAPLDGGWNIVGYVGAELGVGDAARRMAVAFEAAGVSTELVGVATKASRGQHPVRRHVRDDLYFRDSLYCVNADQLERVVAMMEGPAQLGDRHSHRYGDRRIGRRIGLWFWEVDRFPEAWLGAFDLVDEVWCTSPFTAETLTAISPVPVQVMPLPVWAPSAPTPFRREQLGLPPDRFVFLFTYDFNSVMTRKNPLDLIDVYTRSFGPTEGTVLVLKSINGATRPVELDRVRQAAAARPDVVVMDGYVDAHRVQALIELCDCFVSLHRCEGFGLNMAAAMAAGRPVIATGYSGNLAFMDARSAFLVSYDLVPVGPGHPPYPPEANWAQPDLDAAAVQLRHVFDRPELARRTAERGRQTVLARQAPDRAGAAVTARLVAEPQGSLASL